MKRIHEYKRQFMNVLGIIWRYDQIKKMSPEQKAQVRRAPPLGHPCPCARLQAAKTGQQRSRHTPAMRARMYTFVDSWNLGAATYSVQRERHASSALPSC